MSDISIHTRRRAGKVVYLIVAETEVGKRYLKENFIYDTQTEVVSLEGLDPSDLQEIVEKLQKEEMTVEVY